VSEGTETDAGTRRRWLRIGAATASALLVAVVAWFGFELWRSYRDIDKVDFDQDRAQERLDLRDLHDLPPIDPEYDELDDLIGRQFPFDPDYLTSPQLPDDMFDSVLILGSDARPGQGGARADVVLYALRPTDGAAPILASLPRDLWVDNPCTGGRSRINAGLNGCGEHANGPELMAIMVQQFTGIRADHVVELEFEGFKEIIDIFGGVEICVDNPKRQGRQLQLPAGCSVADGELTLAWVRSRNTQEYVDGRWRTVPGVSDLHRNERQQDVLLSLFSEVRELRSITKLRSLAAEAQHAVALDEGLTLGQAVRRTWAMRDVRPRDIQRLSIPVDNHVTSGGAQVLLPQRSFNDVLGDLYPPARRPPAASG
jgi:LCP family protein required for cell wall assembly